MYIAMSMYMTYIQLIQQCTLAIWGGGVTPNFYPKVQNWQHIKCDYKVRNKTRNLTSV